jgi:ribosomal protein L34E
MGNPVGHRQLILGRSERRGNGWQSRSRSRRRSRMKTPGGKKSRRKKRRRERAHVQGASGSAKSTTN